MILYTNIIIAPDQYRGDPWFIEKLNNGVIIIFRISDFFMIQMVAKFFGMENRYKLKLYLIP